MNNNNPIENEIRKVKGFHHYLDHQEGYIWGNISFGGNVHGSGLRLMGYSFTSMLACTSIFFTMNGFIFTPKSTILLITGASILNSLIQLIDTMYLKFHRRLKITYYIYPLSNLAYWCSQAVILAIKNGFIEKTSEIEKYCFWIPIASLIPHLLKAVMFSKIAFKGGSYFDLNQVDFSFASPFYILLGFSTLWFSIKFPRLIFTEIISQD